MKTILIVEDEFGLAEGLSAILSDQGYRVALARDGRQGLERLREAAPDLVLVDYMMPVMNGAQFIREVRKDTAFAKLPIVLMSAAQEDVLRKQEARYDAFLQKPFEASLVLDAIQKLLTEP